jgi:hypothetical protein
LRPLTAEERSQRLARSRGAKHSAPHRRRGASFWPGHDPQWSDTGPDRIAGASDDGSGGRQGSDTGRVH